MNIAIDVLLSLIALSVIIKYTVKGFVKSVLGAITLVVSGVIAFILTPLIFPPTTHLATAVSYLFVFSAAYVIMTIVSFLINKFFKLPILNLLNKLLGFGLGLVCAYISLSVVSAVFMVLLNISSEQLFGQSAEQLRNSTYIYKYFSTFGLFPVH